VRISENATLSRQRIPAKPFEFVPALLSQIQTGQIVVCPESMLRRQLGGRAEHDSLFGSIAVAQEDKYFDSQGVRIRYVEQGNGEPVVLLHGQPSNVERQWTTDTRRRSPSPVARGAADQQRQEGHGVDRPPRSRCFPGATRVPRDVLPQRLVFAARGYHEGVALTARAGERGLQHVFNLSKACDLHNT
jgi:hypothetical protein